MDSCRFCTIINNSKLERPDGFPIYDTILHETANFIVTPALGSIVPGYIMIISRHHICAMAFASQDAMDELSELVIHFRSVISKKFSAPTIVFEHGSAVGCFDKAANSVDHAHIHIAPVHITEETQIVENANASKIPNLHSIASFKGKPYFLYINENNHHFLSHETILPSQYMRKWIAKETGHPLEWDWRQFEFLDNINMTITFLGDKYDPAENKLLHRA